MLSKIKEEFKTATVAFGGSGFPLGERSDIDDLAIIALESGNKELLKFFETLPELQVLKNVKTQNQLSKILDDRKEDDTKQEEPGDSEKE